MNMNIYLFVLLDGLIDSVLAWSAKGRGIESGPTLSIYIYLVIKQLRDNERQNNWKDVGDIPTLSRCQWKHNNEYIYMHFQVVKSTASPISPAKFPF